MEFLNSEARRDKDLHGRVVPMDSEDFRAHSVGFYKRADQWFGRHSKSQPRAHLPQPKNGDMSKHVFATDSGESDPTSDPTTTTPTSADFPALARGPSRPFSSAAVTNGQPPPLQSGVVALWCAPKGSDSSAAGTLCGVSAANRGLLRPVLDTFAQCDQPPPLQSGDVALLCERSAGGGQRFSTVLVEERAAGETTPGPADAGTVFVTDGASTFAVDARDLRRLEIPAELVPRLLSNAGASPSRAPSPHSQAPTNDPWGWLSPAGLASAVEDSVSVAADAVRHLVGKGGNTARLIEDICGVIVGVGDRGDGEAYVTLFGPERRVEAARVLVDAVSRGGAWSLPHRLKQHGYPIG